MEDELYMDNIEEYVFDDRKFVSYKFLSCRLEVHVNIAKRMLYNFVEAQEKKGKKIYVLYYLSGLAPLKWIKSLDAEGKESEEKKKKAAAAAAALNSEGEEDSDSKPSEGSPELFPSSPVEDEEEEEVEILGEDEGDGYLVLICSGDELEAKKRKFKELYSVHVYGVSPIQMSLAMLREEVKKPVVDDLGNLPVHYGPIKCKKGAEFRPNPAYAPMLQQIGQVKQAVKKEKEKFEKEQAEKEKDKETTKKEEPKKAGTAGGKDRLKNMFAAAAAKPKPEKKKEEVVEVKKKTEEPPKKKEPAVKTWGDKKKEAEKVKAEKRERENQRKRKRIRDVFSSSEDEEVEKKKESEDEGDFLPESPIPKKSLQISSESEDEVQVPSKQKSTSVKEKATDKDNGKKTSRGRKQVYKDVKKTFLDDEGYLVTRMERVLASESDHSEPEPERKAKDDDDSDKEDPLPPSVRKAQPQPPSKDKPKKEPAKKPKVVAGSGKQASIMSFFQKK